MSQETVVESYKAALADYIVVLEKSASDTNREQCLAIAAYIRAAEARWPGPPGEAAETAFDQFAKLVESD